MRSAPRVAMPARFGPTPTGAAGSVKWQVRQATKPSMGTWPWKIARPCSGRTVATAVADAGEGGDGDAADEDIAEDG